MGYEITLYIGHRGNPSREIEVDKTQPFEDGSGFHYKRNAKGEYCYTGRTEQWFNVMATIDLCKLGSQDDSLNQLIGETQDKGKDINQESYCYFYASDGNTRVEEDRYGAPLWPAPLDGVAKAVSEAFEASKDDHGPEGYRRLKWASALLESMKGDENLEVIFFGH